MNVFSKKHEIHCFLNDWRISEDDLREAIKEAQAERDRATLHHPLGAGGTFAYHEAVRALRDRLTPKGWCVENLSNYALTINKELGIAIAVASGDKNTGIEDSIPGTKTPKGGMTKLVLQRNQLSFSFFDDSGTFPADESSSTPYKNWLLLYYSCRDEVRVELSLPLYMDHNGYICKWDSRYILTPISFGPESFPPKPDYDQDDALDIEINVRRKQVG